MVITLEESVSKEARYVDNNIIISYTTLCTIITPQLKNISSGYKFRCCCECYICANIMDSSLLSCHDCYLKNIKDLSQNYQNQRSGQMNNCLFET